MISQQKVDKRNRKQWKCHTADSTDWNSKENAKMWRKDLADTINAINEQLGLSLHWEHRSFKEQGIDREPTIHIGTVANALEHKGEARENAKIMLKNGRITVEEIPSFFPKLTLEDARELEVEVMQSA